MSVHCLSLTFSISFFAACISFQIFASRSDSGAGTTTSRCMKGSHDGNKPDSSFESLQFTNSGLMLPDFLRLLCSLVLPDFLGLICSCSGGWHNS
ncbi:hypothetical protein M758_4G095300 [Ceratodon purpureus]|nr:hypothetical protein M758_4G095300 [Ceratodon purpureus]